MTDPVLKMLAELQSGWTINLGTHGPDDAWIMTIRSREGARGGKAHVYRGSLESCIQRAWAGEPADRSYL